MSMKHLMPQYKEQPIFSPNLPKGSVSCVAVSAEAGEAIAGLEALGIETVKISSDLRLPKPVNSHPDIQMLHIGGNEMLCHKGFFATGERLSKFHFNEIEQSVGNKYPEDVRLNCTLIGDKLICNPHTVAPEILRYADLHALTLIPVNQGYARCSVCVVNENAVITDDITVYTAAQNFLNDVLYISKGSIRLDGYNYGFIGGCCGKTDKNTIVFNGVIESHDDHNKIYDFLKRNNVKPVELTNERLEDIGGIIPLTEILEANSK